MQCVSVYNIWFEGEENRCSLFSKLQEKGTYIRTILFKVIEVGHMGGMCKQNL